MDEDLQDLCREQLLDEVKRLRGVISSRERESQGGSPRSMLQMLPHGTPTRGA